MLSGSSPWKSAAIPRRKWSTMLSAGRSRSASADTRSSASSTRPSSPAKTVASYARVASVSARLASTSAASTAAERKSGNARPGVPPRSSTIARTWAAVTRRSGSSVSSEAESALERPAVDVDEGREVLGQRPQQLMQSREGELTLRLDPHGASDAHRARAVARVREQRRLADPGLSTNEQDAAAPAPRSREQAVDRGALTLPADQHVPIVKRHGGTP